MAKAPKHLLATLMKDTFYLTEWINICMKGGYKFFINPTNKEVVIFTNINCLINSVKDSDFSIIKKQILINTLISIEVDVYLSYQQFTLVTFEDASEIDIGIPMHG